MTQAEPQTAFDALGRAFEQAYDSADANALAKLFTEDAVLMPPAGPSLQGREAISGYYDGLFQQFGATRLRIAADEVVVVGELTLARGTWTATRSDGPGGPLRLEGKYMNLSRAQPDGSLRLHRHIVNMAPPPQG
jgi:uncharacterized protein (TIGR02246 family)